jgi:two-component system sensor histidine kinase KdpD
MLEAAREQRKAGVDVVIGGLTICRAIVSAHGRRIWAENRPGGGLVFHFTLPLSEGPPGPAKDRR